MKTSSAKQDKLPTTYMVRFHGDVIYEAYYKENIDWKEIVNTFHSKPQDLLFHIFWFWKIIILRCLKDSIIKGMKKADGSGRIRWTIGQGFTKHCLKSSCSHINRPMSLQTGRIRKPTPFEWLQFPKYESNNILQCLFEWPAC